VFNLEGVASQMNQSFAFKFLCENFQPKLTNYYSNFQWFFKFSIRLLGVYEKNPISKDLNELPRGVQPTAQKYFCGPNSIKFSGYYRNFDHFSSLLTENFYNFEKYY
jgi:hypothetical protein